MRAGAPVPFRGLASYCGSGAGAKLDRLQWWFHLSPEQERQMGDAAIATLRAQATVRFHRHIERWLQNTRQRLHGEDPIPRIDPAVIDSARTDPGFAATSAEGPAASTARSQTTTRPEEGTAEVVPWPTERVANG